MGALGATAVGAAMDAAWERDAETDALLQASSNADGFRAAVEAFLTAERAAESAVERNRQDREREEREKREREEREAREKKEAEERQVRLATEKALEERQRIASEADIDAALAPEPRPEPQVTSAGGRPSMKRSRTAATPFEEIGVIRIRVLGAQDLPVKGTTESKLGMAARQLKMKLKVRDVSLYASVNVGCMERKTDAVRAAPDPKWSAGEMQFPVKAQDRVVKIEVHSSKNGITDILGKVEVVVHGLPSGESVQMTDALSGGNGGSVSFEIAFIRCRGWSQ